MKIDYNKIEKNIEEIIENLKGICSQSGLGNTAAEERIITTVFLYKFLNDKFMWKIKEFAEKEDYKISEILESEDKLLLNAFLDTYSGNVAFAYEDTIEFLIKKRSSEEFYKEFDKALVRISNNPRNENFNIETSDGSKKPLFEEISKEVDETTKNSFVTSIFDSITMDKFDFSIEVSNEQNHGAVFRKNFDFYSRIFEYLIKDYNVASGKYAEYFTPQPVSKIISKILVGMSEMKAAAEIYDPSAGSGSLVLHLANELGSDEGISRSLVYTQDISQKSSRFLRINLLLNGLTESLHNVIQGDTILNPSHFEENDPQSGLKSFDYIVSNPPFKLDFSSTRDNIELKWLDAKNKDGLSRFFAGVPKVPNAKKESMAIYLLFIQHIIFSLNEKGKAAIVVPSGFITEKSGISAKIRKYLVDNKILKGSISMPSNIFANTGTNVSVIFIDKANKSDEIFLMDASNLGEKTKEGKNQKTILSHDEEDLIINTFINRIEKENFSKLVSYKEVTEKNNSLSVGQYFDVKIEYIDITEEEFNNKITEYNQDIEQLVLKSQELDKKVVSDLKNLNLLKQTRKNNCLQHKKDETLHKFHLF
ncbi:HsdM family class I SAM-dependent methyltransferase [Mycoplasmopsis agassizii]|uniref:site-specific DNA-methyltransferase (adenine-specific) n=1 Tax=Mycoplasmopsis agassizii TaxID=33922 RepID=A0ABX4H5Q9_9BACT|nr:N-6 DNA methylase [Mycoplasmopsis agassizii]PAF55239.1 DNA methyltransferase [Mycoplasmopsis agassizii]SMC15658.1 type I restriction enzyme M protein [Mycoplasmopsis agassizii]